VSVPQFYANGIPVAGISYFYNDLDDLKSMRRALARALCPEAAAAGMTTAALEASGEPFFFIVPDYFADREAPKFRRPAITIRLLETLPAESGGQMGPTYNVEQYMQLVAYGNDKPHSWALRQQLRDALESRYRMRIPLFAPDLRLRLARSLRVVPSSLAMGFEDTDDQGKWQAPLTLRATSPRMRTTTPDAPILRSVGVTPSFSE
jgi:hypothetical protein